MNDFPSWTPEAGALIIDDMAAAGRTALLPILHEIQATFGHVPRAALPMIAEALNISRADVHGVVSFYHDFHEAPLPPRVLKLCRAEACQAAGAGAVADEVARRTGAGLGGTSADGQLAVAAVYCLGLCATAPAAMLEGPAVAGGRRLAARLGGARLDRLIDEAMGLEPRSPASPGVAPAAEVAR
ncbi:NAD(P)H-dependent oxidoreductase subunit E [Tistrella bauzanensis]|uniref:NAD(P)H-dependent oxidoreductase subunit E n=1 Tax=Tistrella arctica TaxID=3133430 RepID=A0ABU9YIF7_9PROT